MESCSKRKGRTFSLNCISYLKRNSGSTLVYTEYRYYPTSNRKTRKKNYSTNKKTSSRLWTLSIRRIDFITIIYGL